MYIGVIYFIQSVYISSSTFCSLQLKTREKDIERDKPNKDLDRHIFKKKGDFKWLFFVVIVVFVVSFFNNKKFDFNSLLNGKRARKRERERVCKARV